MYICPRCLRALGPTEPHCKRDGAQALEVPASEAEPALLPEELLPAGAMLGKSYRVVRLIGAGGMGAVYEVQHLRLGRSFAAKLLRRECSRDPGALSRFEREAVAAGRIRHENIIEVVNLDDTEDGRVFIVEELLLGFDLARLCRGEPLPLPLVLSIGVTVARALHSAHQAGIVHRDLKPANIFLARSGDSFVVKVLDFGISKIVGGEDGGRATTTGAFLGTPLYMSPEQAKDGAPVDARADLYSLGVILYELLAGRPPFESKNPLDLALKHVMEAPPPFAARKVAVPAAIEAVVMRALAKAPADRPPSMEALAESLLAAAAESETGVGPLPDRVHHLGAPLSTARTTAPLAQRPGGRAGRWAPLAAGIVALLAIVWVARSRPAVVDTPPVPVATSSAARVTPAVAPPAQVRVSFSSEPSGALVIYQGRSLGQTPLSVSLEPSTVTSAVQFRKPGFRTSERPLCPDRPQALAVRLEPLPAKSTKARPLELPESR